MPVPVQSLTIDDLRGLLQRSAFGLPRWWWRKGYILTILSMRNLVIPARAARGVIYRKAREFRKINKKHASHKTAEKSQSWRKVERLFNDSQVKISSASLYLSL